MPRRRASTSSVDAESETHFVPKEDDDQNLWEVIEILAEKGSRYKVKWAGTDPKGKPWAPTWVKKADCTDDLKEHWKAKQAQKKKSAAAKRPGSAASSKPANRSTSTSTTAASHRTCHTSVNTSLSPQTTRRTSHASGPRASPSPVPPSPHKRRRTAQDTTSEQADATVDSRPRKKRKIQVEIILKSSSKGQLQATAAPEKQPLDSKKEKLFLSDEDSSSVVEDGQYSKPEITNGKSKMLGKRRADSDGGEDMDEGRPVKVEVPITKIGPPRKQRRHRLSDTNESQTFRENTSPRRHGTSTSVASDPKRLSETSRAGPSKNRKNGTSLKTTTAGREQPSVAIAPSTEEDVNDAWPVGPPRNPVDKGKRKAAALSPQTLRLLAQEEEENTQEAAGLVGYSQSSLEEGDDARDETGLVLPSPAVDPSTRKQTDEGQSRRTVQHGRASANDTFSREGIVPETQAKVAPDLNDPPYDPTQDDLSVSLHLPTTPSRPRAVRDVSASGSSIVSKMKSKKRDKRKDLRPIGEITPPDFRPYLPSTQLDDIEEFSSPEQERRKRTSNPVVQETIGDADLTQEIESYVDWDGGLDREESKEEKDKQSEFESPPLQDPPPTSTTQRADADSQSQAQSILDAQELTALLDEKEEMLALLESQIVELQGRIEELEEAQPSSSHKAELDALQEASNEKSEQISALEDQLVELQLQVTEMTNERAQHESQIRALQESLEERDEQTSQLEAALVELQGEIERLGLENESLSAQLSSTETRGAQEAQLTAKRLADLEDELSSTRAKLSHAEADAAALSARLQSTVQDWERRTKNAEDDRAFLRRQYDDASTHAQRLAQENRALEERAQRAEGQAAHGVAMVRSTFEQQIRMLQAEVERWKGTCMLLTDRDARTDDEVRRRAALEPSLQEENGRLRVEALIARRETNKLLELVEHMQKPPPPGGDGVDGDDEDEDGDFVPDPDEEDGSSSSSSDSESPSVTPEKQPVPVSSPDDDEWLHVCSYVSGTAVCNATFSSSLDVIEHAVAVHYQL